MLAWLPEILSSAGDESCHHHSNLTPTFGSTTNRSSSRLCNWGRSHCIVPCLFLPLQHPLHSCIAVTPLYLGHLLCKKDEVGRARRGTVFSLGLSRRHENLQTRSFFHALNELSQGSICISLQLCCLDWSGKKGWGGVGARSIFACSLTIDHAPGLGQRGGGYSMLPGFVMP